MKNEAWHLNLWTDEQNKLLTELWVASVRAAEIARRVSAIGPTRTVGSVIDKAMRLRLFRRQRPCDWSPEMTKRAADLWREGYSSSRIALTLNAEFGVELTRNAVIGNRHRRAYAVRRDGPIIRIAEVRRVKFAKPRAQGPLIPLAEILDSNIPIDQRKQLFDLGRSDCRWPVGEPSAADFFFCGGKTAEGCSYCPAHFHRSINKGYRRSQYAGAECSLVQTEAA